MAGSGTRDSSRVCLASLKRDRSRVYPALNQDMRTNERTAEDHKCQSEGCEGLHGFTSRQPSESLPESRTLNPESTP
jgi:hypothetical protein